MRITICSSARFVKEAYEIKRRLEEMGHEVFVYPQKVKLEGKPLHVTEFYVMRKKEFNDKYWHLKNELINEHFKKIEMSDAILVLNYDRDDTPGYIGGNTFLEMGIAHYLNKKIFLWKRPSENLPYFEEIMALNPIIINGKLEEIAQ